MRIPIFRLMLGALLGVLLTAGSGLALDHNQTMGFGAGKLLTFDYEQNFSCIHQPDNDLNYNGVPADADPQEFQTPICVVGKQPTINPPGGPIAKTEVLYVLVPMFSLNSDRNPNDAIPCKGVVAGTVCGPALGNFLIAKFGFVPEAFKTTPAVFTQCPDPGSPPGTCTMHASRVDLGPVLAALGKIPSPATANVFVPTPNHSHVIDNDQINDKPIWWQVRPVLILDPRDWPPEDGSSGITSVAAMDAAEKAGDAIEAPSNFFLFFGSKVTKMNMENMR